MKNKNFNIAITGAGGQGIITLISIIDEAAFIDGYDVKSSELHGLSQRGGGVMAHIRFGRKIYSPLVSQGEADLIIGLELLEGLRGASFAGAKTNFLVNKYSLPFIGGSSEKEILENLNKAAKNNLHLISASETCKRELGKEVLSGVYSLGYAVFKKLIPLRPESVLRAIDSIIPEKYRDMNIKAFNLPKNLI